MANFRHIKTKLAPKIKMQSQGKNDGEGVLWALFLIMRKD
jgi:hypothetical protein